MSTGYLSDYGGSLLDLDQIFDFTEPGVAGDTGFLAGYDGGGQDLARLFTARSKGADIGYNTGFIAADGRDLREWFCKAGSARQVWFSGNMVAGRDTSNQLYGYAAPSTGSPFGTWTPVVVPSPVKNASGIHYSITTLKSTFVTSPGGLLTPGLFECRFEWTIAGTPYSATGVVNTSGTYDVTPANAFVNFQTAFSNGQPFLFEVLGTPVVLGPNEFYPMVFSGSFIGYNPPYSGLINPTTINGLTIALLYSGGGSVFLSTSGNPAQNHFNSITVNGTTYTSASATFTPYYDDGEGGGNLATWQWPGALPVTEKVIVPFSYN
jgi:hypothetical protein